MNDWFYLGVAGVVSFVMMIFDIVNDRETEVWITITASITAFVIFVIGFFVIKYW